MAKIHNVHLDGVVNPNGADTTVKFEYGLDTTYGSEMVLSDIFVGKLDLPVSTDVLGLEALTLYHWRVSATNSVGTSVGDDAVFTTLDDPAGLPIVTTGTATNLI